MTSDAAQVSFRKLGKAEKQALFLDIRESPRFEIQGSLGERFHGWLEEQAAEGFTLGQIAERMKLPYPDLAAKDPWPFLEEYVTWMIDRGHAQVVRIEVVAATPEAPRFPELERKR